jgi:pimeloyl-ACP methyl ester carboxylesterase
MKQLLPSLRIFIFVCLFPVVTLLVPDVYAQEESKVPIRNIITFEGVEREYFVRKPQNFNSNKCYWLVVVVHGGGGNGQSYWLADGINTAVTDLGLNALIVTPSFSNTDFQASRFPTLGEGAFLKLVINEVQSEFRLHKKILLTGYSRGGQFTHRFAFQNPNLVKACATFSAGTWTTPDGKLLFLPDYEAKNPESFLSSKTNATKVAERFGDMFQPRVAKVAGREAKKGAKKIPFLVMCGTLDPRFEAAKQFSKSLEVTGFRVQTQWPETPHGGRAEYPKQFLEYSTSAVEFFIESIGKR